MSKITDNAFLFQKTFGTSGVNAIGSFQLSQLNSSSVQSKLKAAGINTNSKQYKAAVKQMMSAGNGAMYGNIQGIKNLMSHYDKDGDYINPVNGLAGLLVTDENESSRKRIISIPDSSKEEMYELTKKEWTSIRGKRISMIFQDSGAMMNPTRKVGKVFTEYILTHENISKKEAWSKGIAMLERMRLPSPDNIMESYPFQLSGGMRQRVGIAMGMTYQPKLLLADEPTSALDVTTQAQIVRQMMKLRDDYHTGIIVVTHNLGVAAYMSDYIVVMKNGRMEDQGTREYILKESKNEYTRKLLEAVPSRGGERYV